MFFMAGRESRRISDRIGAREKAEIRFSGLCADAMTEDVSEEGIALRISEGDDMRDMPGKGDRFEITVRTEHYRADLYALCVYAGNGRIAAVVEPADEAGRRSWLQIIHDREHSLPRELDPWMTVYDEISQNILARRKKR